MGFLIISVCFCDLIQITNACATQAICNCLLNCPDIELGPDLETCVFFFGGLFVFVILFFSFLLESSYREFTIALPPEMRGLALDEVKLRDKHKLPMFNSGVSRIYVDICRCCF